MEVCSLLLQLICDWLHKQGVEYKESEDFFVMPTICHNVSGGSWKLYLYKNEDEENPLFHCYTECSETFNIYQLIIKYRELRGEEYTFRDAYKELHGTDIVGHSKPVTPVPEYLHPPKEIQNPLDVYLPEYAKLNTEVLFPMVKWSPWEIEGISATTLEDYGISFCPDSQQLIIPHLDWRGRLVGYRIRHFAEDQIPYGKYRPLSYNGVIYRHPLSHNLYGWSEASDIHTTKEVYLYEGEKSVLLHTELTGVKNAVAVCGSSISTWQQRFISLSKVDVVYICFDRDYQNWEELYALLLKWKSMTNILQCFATVVAVVDTYSNILPHKASPIDNTVQDFNKLQRIVLNSFN